MNDLDDELVKKAREYLFKRLAPLTLEDPETAFSDGIALGTLMAAAEGRLHELQEAFAWWEGPIVNSARQTIYPSHNSVRPTYHRGQKESLPQFVLRAYRAEQVRKTSQKTSQGP